jgi:hypothetical protein
MYSHLGNTPPHHRDQLSCFQTIPSVVSQVILGCKSLQDGQRISMGYKKQLLPMVAPLQLLQHIAAAPIRTVCFRYLLLLCTT